MPKVLITDHAWPLTIEHEILGSADIEIVEAQVGDEEELTALAHNVDAIMTNWKKVPPSALQSAPKCRLVARYGVGVDNIPVDVATELGIVVTNIPDFCIDEVTDHAMALLLACARRITRFDRAVHSGGWNLTDIAPGMQRLRGKVVGLVGFGQLGQAMAKKASAFGMVVVAYTPRLTQDEIEPGLFTTNDFDDLLARADFLSLHLPVRPETRNLIDEHAFRKMKPDSYLINTARGAIVDESALYRAVTEGQIVGAGIDVMASEPLPADSPLRGLENVILTPHAAFYSEQAIEDLQRRASLQVVDMLSGKIPPNVVNQMVLESPQLRGPA